MTGEFAFNFRSCPPTQSYRSHCGRGRLKVIFGDFPWVGLSCRTWGLGSLCTAKDLGRCVLCTTQHLCYASFLKATYHQHCEKPALFFSQTRALQLLGSVIKPNIQLRSELKWESEHCEESETWLMSLGLMQPGTGNCPDPPHLWDGLQKQKEITQMGIFQ